MSYLVWHSVYMESRFFDGMNYLLFMSQMYYWGRRDPITRTNIITVEHWFVNTHILLRKSPLLDCSCTELNMIVNGASQAWQYFCAFRSLRAAFWIAALLVFWLNYESMFDNRWQSDLLRRGSCPWTDDTPPSLQLLCPATALWAAALCLASHPSV